MIPVGIQKWRGKQLRVWRAHNRSHHELRQKPHIYPTPDGTWAVACLRGKQSRIRTYYYREFKYAAGYAAGFARFYLGK